MSAFCFHFIQLTDKVLTTHTAIQFAITLDGIWSLRNQLLHCNHKINIPFTVKVLEARILEHIQSLEVSNKFDMENQPCWEAPPIDFTKLNIDAALSSDKATIAVIARDQSGTIINAWAKQNDILDPTVAEANAIHWALELASSFGFKKVIVESDAKNCIEDLSGHPDSSNWRISAVSSQLLDLVSCFSYCKLQWVRRDANQVAHSLAKNSLTLELPLCYKKVNLPPSVKEAWFRDLFSVL